MRLLLIAGHHVGRLDKGSNSAKPLCVIIASIALEPVDRYGFRIAKPATTVGNDVRAFESTRSTRGCAMLSSPMVCSDT